MNGPVPKDLHGPPGGASGVAPLAAGMIPAQPWALVTRITSDLQHAAACRLVAQNNPDIESAARRLVAASGKHGIDLSLIWATVEPGHIKPVRRKVRQACLAVLGSGRTAMMFLSEPPRDGDAGGSAAALAERTACVRAACAYLRTARPRDVRIAQALPEPTDAWALGVFAEEAFVKVGDLSYLRRTTAGLAAGRSNIELGADEDLVSFDRIITEVGKARADAMMIEALDRSYEQTLDCPELCGLRETKDVLESHRSTGQFDPRLWWLLRRGGKTAGCLLLNPCPDLQTVELVYLGLAPAARGTGLGRRILEYGLGRACANRTEWEVACAVDDRNAPARKLYDAMGFRLAGKRVALVKPL